MKQLYSKMANVIQARLNCIESKNDIWISKHEDTLNELIDLLPHGSGIDGKTTIDLEKSTGEKLILNVEFHHMNDVGLYDGWTQHKIIVTPSLMHGISMRITGINRNGIKEYFGDIFHIALTEANKEE